MYDIKKADPPEAEAWTVELKGRVKFFFTSRLAAEHFSSELTERWPDGDAPYDKVKALQAALSTSMRTSGGLPEEPVPYTPASEAPKPHAPFEE